MSNVKSDLFKIARPITTDENKYTYISSNYHLSNYRLISSGEVAVRGRNLDLPYYVREFIKDHDEVLMICNVLEDEVSGIVFRGLKEKAFINYGFGKGSFYGIGDLDKNFKFGDLIVLVEGAIDRDVCKLFITKNCLSCLTANVSNNQLQVLSCLTNRVLLLLDNDEAGINGEFNTKQKLNKAGITVCQISKSSLIKDLGDLLELKRKNDPRANIVINAYRAQVQIHGGKVV